MTEGLASLTLSLRRRFNIRSVTLALPQHSQGPAPLQNIKGQEVVMVAQATWMLCSIHPSTKQNKCWEKPLKEPLENNAEMYIA